MALQRAYCTRRQVRDDLRNKAVDEDTIEAAIHAASRWIDRYKGRDYVLHDHSVTPLTLAPGIALLAREEILLLPKTPVITLTAVTDNGVALVEGTDFVQDGDHSGNWKLVRIDGKWSGRAVTLQGTFGYAEAPSPTRIDLTGKSVTVTITASPDIVGDEGDGHVTVTSATSGEFFFEFSAGDLAPLGLGEWDVTVEYDDGELEEMVLEIVTAPYEPEQVLDPDGRRRFRIAAGDGWEVKMTAATGPGVGDQVFKVPGHINRAAVMLAANLSGHQQKDVAGLDGQMQTILDRSVPKPVLDLLGAPFRAV